MSWFLLGLAVGAIVSFPVIPLLRATDPTFGAAAAGLTVVAVLMFAVRVHLEIADHDDVRFSDVSFSNATAVLFNSALAIKGVFGFAIAVAIAGCFVQRRARL
jgi:hypothetical protein